LIQRLRSVETLNTSLESTATKLADDLRQSNVARREAQECCNEAYDQIIELNSQLASLTADRQQLQDQVNRLQVSVYGILFRL
jgi:chromosome segregation ATPase